MTDTIETKPLIPVPIPTPTPTPAPVVLPTPVPAPEVESDEKTLLMARARMMGLKISNNIGLDTLKAKIAEHLSNEHPEQAERHAQEIEKIERRVPPQIAAEALPVKPLTYQQKRDKLIREQMKLVRLRITCLDPKKKNLPGEIFTLANKYLGTVRKFVPFGEQTENGYHVPYCIYQMLKDRKFLHIRTIKTREGERTETSYVPEFALEVLPQLTPIDLQKLATAQTAAGNL